MKKRMIGATLLTVVVALVISSLVGIWTFRVREMDAARQNLQELLILMDAQSAVTDASGIAEQFLQAAPDKRLTIITPEGEVLADTQLDPDDLGDHTGRPEITMALTTGWGEATRRSESTGETMLYVAKRFADGVVGRASMPLSSINSLVLGSVWAFALAAAAGLLLALALARRTASKVLEPLNVVGNALQGVLDGTGTPVLEEYQADDELRPILRYIDKLMERLGGYIQSIKEERDKVSLILDCMDEGLILLDEKGNVLATNRAARALFGLPADGDEDGALLLTRSRRLREAIAEAGEKNTAVVLEVDALNDDARSLRLFVSPVAGRQFEGENVGTSILITDVTDLKRAEGIRSEFTANVSHELKTPLTSIKGFTDMLSSGMVASPEDQKRFITMIGVEVDRLIDLINDILKLSELESVAIEQCEETTDILSAAREAAELLAPAAKAAGVVLTVQGGGAVAAVPRGRLKELLINLMENGVKYNEPGGSVAVSVSQEDGHSLITVTDTGIGIPEEAQKRVFERFYRVDKGRARKNGGTGLGLAIVKHIVQLYGGSVELESQVGKGSTFRVTLPSAKL
mgnify:CR=1 FL=1